VIAVSSLGEAVDRHFELMAQRLELAAGVSDPTVRRRRLRMARSFEMHAALLATSRSMIDKSRRLLTALQIDRAIINKVDAELLATSRSMINESKRLLTTLDDSISVTSGDEAHYEPTAIITAPAQATGVSVRSPSNANRGTLSVHIHHEGTRFVWAVYGPGPTKAMLGRGIADTELKARADAFHAGMTYIEQLKGEPAVDYPSLH
jgi:hypothetical protein